MMHEPVALVTRDDVTLTKEISIQTTYTHSATSVTMIVDNFL
jgi:hypothetical protein